MYVKGSERKFRGMRGFDPGRQLVLQHRGPRSPFSGVEDTLTTGVSKILDRAAQGIDTKNLPGALKSADALAQKYLGVGADKAKARLLQFLYLQARSQISGLLQNAVLKAGAAAVTTGTQVAGYVTEIQTKFKTGEPLDASGVADVASLSNKIVGSIVGFLKTVGALDSKVSGQIMEWSNVAMGCAAAVGAIGPYAGAASCALQFVGQLVDTLAQKDDYPAGKAAIFVPSDEQILVAAADAMRLAAILRYQYRVPSYASLYNANILQNDPGDPNARYLQADYYPSLNSKEPMTAVDMRVALAMLRFDGPDAVPPAGAGGATSNGWLTTRHVLSIIGRGGYACTGNCGRGTYDRAIEDTYLNDHDVDVMCIDYAVDTMLASSPQYTRAWGLDAFKRAYELINFFAALTVYEIRSGVRIIQTYTSPAYDLPVRLYAVADSGGHDCRHDFFDYDCAPYGKKCWTSLNRCLIPTEQCKSELVGLQTQLESSDNVCALRQVGAIRLMAAFSYLHMAYMKGYSFGTALDTRDIIAGLAPESDPAIGVQLPVKIYDKAWVATILSRMEARAKEIKTLNDIALAAAKQDHLVATLSSAAAAAFQAPTTTASGYSAKTDPGVAFITGSSQLKATLPTTPWHDDSGGGTALLAGAALAALLLLKK